MKKSLYIMKKLIRKLYHLIWFLSLFILFSPLVYATDGIINGSIYSSDISASAQAQWYDVNHNEISTSLINNAYFSPYFQAGARYNSYLSFNVYTNLQTNVLYSLTVYLNDNTNTNLIGWNNAVATGTFNGGANSNNSSSSCRADIYSFVDSYNIKYKININEDGTNDANTGAYYITFKPTCRGNYLNIPVAFTSPGTYMYFYGYHLEVLGLTDGLTSNDIRSVINSSGLATANSVSQVQSSVNQVQQELSNLEESERQNAEDIMDNQNSNTDKQIESQKVCKTINIDKNYSSVGGYLNSSGNVLDNTQYITTDFVTLGSNSKIEVLHTYTETDYRRLCFYNNNKTNISCIVANTLSDGQQVTIPDNASFVRFTVRKTDNLPTYKVLSCENGNQALNDSINGLNDSITDDNAPSIDLSDIQTSDTPISDLVTLPLTLLNSIYNGISGSCSNWNLLLPFNHSILLRCFTISDYVGSNVASIIDTAICLFMSYRIILLFISIFNDITTLSDTYTNYVKRGRY